MDNYKIQVHFLGTQYNNDLNFTANELPSCDCELVFVCKTSGYVITRFAIPTYTLVTKFIRVYNPTKNTSYQLENSNGVIMLTKKNDILEVEVSRYGSDVYGELKVYFKIGDQINNLVQEFKQIEEINSIIPW